METLFYLNSKWNNLYHGKMDRQGPLSLSVMTCAFVIKRIIAVHFSLQDPQAEKVTL